MRKLVQSVLVKALRFILVVTGLMALSHALRAYMQNENEEEEMSDAAWPTARGDGGHKSGKEGEKALQGGEHQSQSEGAQVKKECLNCGDSGAKLRCSKCKRAYFCSRECQTKAWKTHKADCMPPGSSSARASNPEQGSKERKRRPLQRKKKQKGSGYAFTERVESLDVESDSDMELPTPEIKNHGISRGKLAISHGEPEKALDEFEGVLNDKTEDKAMRGNGAFLAANAAEAAGKSETADERLEQALELARETENMRLEHEVGVARGNFKKARGDGEGALAEYERVAQSLRGTGSLPDIRATALASAGEVDAREGRAEEGAQKLKEAVDLWMERGKEAEQDAEKLEALRGFATASLSHGATLLAAQRTKEAIEPYEHALEAGECALSLDVQFRALASLVLLSEEYDDEHVTERCNAFLKGLWDMISSACGEEPPDQCPHCNEALAIGSEAATTGSSKVLVLTCSHMIHRGCADAALSSGGDKCPHPECPNTLKDEVYPASAFPDPQHPPVDGLQESQTGESVSDPSEAVGGERAHSHTILNPSLAPMQCVEPVAASS